MQKKIFKPLLLGLATLSLAACGNLSRIHPDGSTDNPVFPNAADVGYATDAKYKGKWVQKEDVALIKTGMNKQQVYDLIGNPHFSEGFFEVREWDYVLNYTENGEVKTCQYKVIFDAKMLVGQQYWKPENCSLRSDLTTTTANSMPPSSPESKPVHKKISPKKKKLIKKSAPIKALEIIAKKTTQKI